jgi:hypothetical protein
MTIFSDITDLPLWWAYKYGNYRHKDLHIIETNDGEEVNKAVGSALDKGHIGKENR